MHFHTILVASIAATVVAHAAPCDLLALAPIATGSSATKCTADSGLQFMPPQMPTSDQVPKLCASSACRVLLAELKKAAPTECTIALTTPPIELYAQVVTPLEKVCESVAVTTAPPTTAPPATTPAPTTTLPSTTSVAPTTEPPSAPTAAPPSEAPIAPSPSREQC